MYDFDDIYDMKRYDNYVISANTTNVFKNRLGKFWQNQVIIYDFKAQLEGTGSRSDVQ